VKPKTPSAKLPLELPVLAPRNLPYQMFLLVQQMTRRFQEILTPHGITPLHWGILCCLWGEDGLRTTEIAARLEQLGGTVTVGLDVMERLGLVRRKKDKADGRILRIFLTERGRILKKTLEPAAAALIQEMFVTFAPEEYNALSSHIARLRNAVAKPIRSMEEQN
jgi:DNA-binding MarR family transcriptional regulator